MLGLLVSACSEPVISPDTRDFNLIFSYGVSARNVLNTFQNTYTEDLIMDGTITVPFVLKESQLQEINSRMVEIGFF